VLYFKSISQYLSEVIEEDQGNISKNNLLLNPETNPGLSEYEAGILTLQVQVIYTTYNETQHGAAILGGGLSLGNIVIFRVSHLHWDLTEVQESCV
jgi:hypothetical protein